MLPKWKLRETFERYILGIKERIARGRRMSFI